MDQITHTLWQDVLRAVRSHLETRDRGLLDRIEPGTLVNGELWILTNSAEDRRLLEEKYRTTFVQAAQEATGRLIGVRFSPVVGSGHTDVAGLAPSAADTPRGVRLNPENTFDNFVVGPCNRLAQAASLAICDSLGRAYNPLFLHGDAGLGKTHLLQAACWAIRRRWPEVSILYLSCEEFINDFLEAVESGVLHSFRYRYRHIDLLVIDDIQFLAKHEQTQEEFFHTFNTLYQEQKQIIVSADTPPAELSSLEDRLISRFNWGLVARIDNPCFDTRMAILHKKAKARDVALPDDVTTYIASRIDSNIRALEGAINSLQAMSLATGGPIDVEMACTILGEAAPSPPEISMQDILNAVTQRFASKLGDLLGKRRTRSIALPRQVAMYLIYKHTRLSLKEIGGHFGGRDHTTVLHARQAIERQMEQDKAFRSMIQDIERHLKR